MVRMLGIVLWSSSAKRKAVIWCADHGDLAYLSDPDTGPKEGAFDGTPIDTGDLVEFDCDTSTHVRMADNLRIVTQEQRVDPHYRIGREIQNSPAQPKEGVSSSHDDLGTCRTQRGPPSGGSAKVIQLFPHKRKPP